MHKVLPAPIALPLHLQSSSRAFEAEALDGLPPLTLMERAGQAGAKLAKAIAPHAQRILVICGPGNNGGDGLVVSRLLASAGLQVHTSLLNEGRALPADAAQALQKLHAAGLQVHDELPAASVKPDLVIDALLGLGLSRAPSHLLAQGIAHINQQACPVLALDLPSGLMADTGALAGAEAVRATHTLALLTLKPGLFTGEGRAHAGEIWLDDLACAPAPKADAWLSGADSMRSWQMPGSHSSHKGSQGDLLVLGGAPGMQGAAWLAGSAALAAGAGRSYVCLLGSDNTAPWPARPELMRWDDSRLASLDQRQDLTLVCGCGGGTAVHSVLAQVLAHAARLVLDADALNAVASDDGLRNALHSRRSRGQDTVLTPHPLEAARLLNCSTADIQSDRLTAAANLSRQLLCTVLLKGSGTVIASEGETLTINSSGNAALATPGTGDVLAGWLGGLWAQRPNSPLHELAAAACYWHGAAARDYHGPLRAVDLIERMRQLRGPGGPAR